MSELIHPSTDCTFEELSHTAEIGLRVRAVSPAALFACAGAAMFRLLDVPISDEQVTHRREITIEAADAESLLVDWLNELLYLYETTGVAYARSTVIAWHPARLTAAVAGAQPEHPPTMHIKAVTYHQLRVAQEDDAWLAQVYFDI